MSDEKGLETGYIFKPAMNNDLVKNLIIKLLHKEVQCYKWSIIILNI